MTRLLGVKIRYFLKDFLKAMEAWAKKWPRKGSQKWTRNRTPFWEPRCSETQGIQRVFGAFWQLRGVRFGLVSGVILGSFLGPPDLETFPYSEDILKAKMGVGQAQKH